jgi:hypothetical protein
MPSGVGIARASRVVMSTMSALDQKRGVGRGKRRQLCSNYRTSAPETGGLLSLADTERDCPRLDGHVRVGQRSPLRERIGHAREDHRNDRRDAAE